MPASSPRSNPAPVFIMTPANKEETMFRVPGHRLSKRILAATTVLALGTLGAAGGGVAQAASFCSSNTINAVYVTITEVDAHIAKQKGFQTLATGGPTQIDLLAPNDGTSSGSCILGALGDINGLAPGKYGQIRVMLGANGDGHGKKPGAPNLPSNACESLGGLPHNVVNCVEFTPNGGSPEFASLDVGSAANTGIKVPPGQLGGLTVSDGELLDLLVTIDPCSEIVAAGFGQGKGKGNSAKKFKLKPTLHRGQVALTPFVAGTVVEGDNSASPTITTTTTPVSGANVWLETGSTAFTSPAGSDLVNNVVGTTVSNSNGTFEFCPVGAGTYEAVADASSVGAHGSDATISTGITVSGTAGPNNITIPLVEAGSSGFNAEFDSDGSAPISIAYGGAQFDSSPSGNTLARIPFLDGAAPDQSVTTATSGGGCTCPVNCACTTVNVPNDGPVIGSGTTYTLQTDNLAVHGATTTACSDGQALITDPSGAPPPNPTLNFTGCP